MSDSSAIDQALLDLLLNDAALRALLPDGVFFEEAGASMLHGGHSTRFVRLSVVEAIDEPVFGRRAYEDVLYAVIAVELSTGVLNSRAAAARIDVLLEDGALTVTGYTPMVMCREARIRFVEVDDVDPAIRWSHRGGHYRVQQALV